MGELTGERWEVAAAVHVGRDGRVLTKEYFVRRPGDDVAIAAEIVDPDTEEPSASRACLIVAAPDLLAAAETAEEILYHSLRGSECEPDCECVLHPLRAAIAKVRGEQQ